MASQLEIGEIRGKSGEKSLLLWSILAYMIFYINVTDVIFFRVNFKQRGDQGQIVNSQGEVRKSQGN